MTSVGRIAVASAIAVLWTVANQVAAADLQEDLEMVLTEESLTGIAWTLIGEAGEASVGTAGLQDNHSGVPFATDTRFHVGSLTKTLLTTAC